MLFRAGRYAIRVCGPDVPASRVQAENDIVAALEIAGVPCIIVLGTVAVDGHTATVIPWLESVRPATWADVGRLAAAMHRVAAPPATPRFDMLGVTRGRLTRLRTEQAATPAELEAAAALQRAETTCERAEQFAARSPRLVHGDLTPGNVLVTEAGPTLHDFENSGAGHPARDLLRPWHGAVRFAGRGAEAAVEFETAYRAAGGASVDRELLRELYCGIDVVGAVWCLAGRALDPVRFTAEAGVRMTTLEQPSGVPTWSAL